MVPPPPLPAGRPAFRPDLEGLRGVAILLVVAFHAGVSALPGGFVGVDVFFVLSGFLITGLLVREFASDGRIDLGEFYGKRNLRLLPALLVVLFATLAAVSWLYAPIDRADIAASARAVALYSGNIEFARSSLDYFSSGDNPLLHTWSLGVEQQFYLVWPLLFLMVGAMYGRKLVDDAGDGATRKRLLIALAIVGAASLVASVWITRSAQHWAFFGMPTRIWEFALGGAVALLISHPEERSDEGGGGDLQFRARLCSSSPESPQSCSPPFCAIAERRTRVSPRCSQHPERLRCSPADTGGRHQQAR